VWLSACELEQCADTNWSWGGRSQVQTEPTADVQVPAAVQTCWSCRSDPCRRQQTTAERLDQHLEQLHLIHSNTMWNHSGQQQQVLLHWPKQWWPQTMMATRRAMTATIMTATNHDNDSHNNYSHIVLVCGRHCIGPFYTTSCHTKIDTKPVKIITLFAIPKGFLGQHCLVCVRQK